MNVKLKASLFVLFLSALSLSGAVKSLAQDSNSSDEQAREAQTQEALNQVHDLEVKIQDHGKRLDALEKAIDQLNVPEPSAEADVKVKSAPVPAVVPAQKIMIAQKADPALAAAFVPETSANNAPLVFRQPPVYFAPMTYYPKAHTFELSQEDYYSTFKETGDLQDYKKSGEFTGLYTAYTYRAPEAENWPVNVVHLDVHGDYGYMDYNYHDGDKVKDVNNYIVEPRFWMGKDLHFGVNMLTGYVGAGYRWYYDQLKNKNDVDGDAGFNIQTQYLYIPVGATLSLRPSEGWRIDINGEYDYLAWGRVTDYFSDLDPAAPNLANTLQHGHGLKGSVKIVKEEGRFNYFFEPYVSYWKIKASKNSEIFADGYPVLSYQEDRNSTTEIGARAGVDF